MLGVGICHVPLFDFTRQELMDGWASAPHNLLHCHSSPQPHTPSTAFFLPVQQGNTTTQNNPSKHSNLPSGPLRYASETRRTSRLSLRHLLLSGTGTHDLPAARHGDSISLSRRKSGQSVLLHGAARSENCHKEQSWEAASIPVGDLIFPLLRNADIVYGGHA